MIAMDKVGQSTISYFIFVENATSELHSLVASYLRIYNFEHNSL